MAASSFNLFLFSIHLVVEETVFCFEDFSVVEILQIVLFWWCLAHPFILSLMFPIKSYLGLAGI